MFKIANEFAPDVRTLRGELPQELPASWPCSSSNDRKRDIREATAFQQICLP